MLNRSSPRAITRSVIANGNTSASAVPFFPVYSSASSRSCPRATVPATIGRAERASEKNVDSRSGMYFGWSCMSCRQPALSNTDRAKRLVFNGSDLARLQRFKKLARFLEIELRVARLDDEKK